jgi:transposase InsO family protein
MSYTQNPYQPKLRRDVAAYAYREGVRPASRHFGIPPGTVTKWMQKAKVYGVHPIPTRSSRPRSHPKQLSDDVVKRIIELRLKTKRTSEVVHTMLKNEGINVSLNSVRRTIDRHGLMKKRSHLKRWHPPVERPKPQKPGDLVQMDTIHRMIDQKKRLYIFVILDVYSRWVYAKAFAKMNARTSIKFVREAELRSAFPFEMLQSDHGPEFGMWFVEQMKKNHRYTRIGKPNDNAHIERFNRTVQEECIDKIPTDVRKINCALKKYLQYYNHERLHMGISLRAPIQLIT